MPASATSAEARFSALVDRDGPETPGLGRCWRWTGAIDANGYGRFTVASYVSVGAHRFAWQVANGPPPEGLVIDHLCRNRCCVNPAHLEPVTNAENILRGEGPPARNARKTHCDRGHQFTVDNTYRHPDGRRECRACRREYMRDYMRRRRSR